jgi:hypothetical protein
LIKQKDNLITKSNGKNRNAINRREEVAIIEYCKGRIALKAM